MGLASLWVSDRLLLPTRPKETFDGDPWPEIFATVYDPIEMLTFAAARTRKVKLGTSVLSALFQNPVTLARRFATLDRLSALERAARIADGIMPAAGRSTTVGMLSQTINNFHDMVRRAGRNPEEMKWILRVHNPLTEEKATEPRTLLGGTPEQAAEDLPRLKELGIDHVFYDMNHPAHVPINTQLVLLRKLMQIINA